MSIKVHFYEAIYINFWIIAVMWVISQEKDSIRISKQWKSATRDKKSWLTNAERYLNNIEHNRQSRKWKILPSFLCSRRFYFCCLLNSLMKIIVILCIFNRAIVFLNKQTNIYWFNYELRGFYDFNLRNIGIGQYYIYKKEKEEKMSFSKNEAFLYNKNGS